MAKRISIINFKGGVGKTTLAFHLGTGLAYFGKEEEGEGSRVLLIDMDHQSSLSVLCLGLDAWHESVEREHTVDTLFRPFVGDEREVPGDAIIIQSPMHRLDSGYDRLDIVPASLRLDNVEIELTASRMGNANQTEWNKRTQLCRWIEESGVDDEYDYIIFDCPPATKIVSQNAIAASHGYIIPVVPEAVMERGAPHLRDMMQSGIDALLKELALTGAKRAMYVPDTQLVGLAITRIQVSGRSSSGYTNDHTQHLRSLQTRWGTNLLYPYIVQGTGVSAALSDGLPVFSRWKDPNISKREIHVKFAELMFNIKSRIDAL